MILHRDTGALIFDLDGTLPLRAHVLGVSAADCVAFEDSRNGIAAARTAGMTVVALNSRWVDPTDLVEADIIIENFREALPWLDVFRP